VTIEAFWGVASQLSNSPSDFQSSVPVVPSSAMKKAFAPTAPSPDMPDALRARA